MNDEKCPIPVPSIEGAPPAFFARLLSIRAGDVAVTQRTCCRAHYGQLSLLEVLNVHRESATNPESNVTLHMEDLDVADGALVRLEAAGDSWLLIQQRDAFERFTATGGVTYYKKGDTEFQVDDYGDWFPLNWRAILSFIPAGGC